MYCYFTWKLIILNKLQSSTNLHNKMGWLNCGRSAEMLQYKFIRL